MSLLEVCRCRLCNQIHDPYGPCPWGPPSNTGYEIIAADPIPKPTNPKDAIGTDKVPMGLVSDIAIAEEALAMLEGALKYGANNYMAIGVRASIYLDALERHVAKWKNGEERDPLTGVHHLGSARACLGILLVALSLGNLTDDRPPRNPDFSQQIDALAQNVKELRETFKEKSPKHYTIADGPPECVS